MQLAICCRGDAFDCKLSAGVIQVAGINFLAQAIQHGADRVGSCGAALTCYGRQEAR